MTKFLIVVIVIAALLAVYAFWGREWLKSKPWATGFFAWVEPTEIALFKKSETILFARLKMLSGIILVILTQAGTIDLTPIMPLLPDAYASYVRIAFNLLPLGLTLIGAIDEKLRNATTKPIELVAVPDAAAPPEVKAAIAQADAAKEVAVAAVEQAKVA